MAARPENPAPLTVAASLVLVQGLLLLVLAVLELASTSADRVSVGVSVGLFFALYGVALVACARALHLRHGWARGPVLITQLISLGLAWNVRDVPLVAVLLVLTAAAVLAGVLHPASQEALADS